MSRLRRYYSFAKRMVMCGTINNTYPQLLIQIKALIEALLVIYGHLNVVWAKR